MADEVIAEIIKEAMPFPVLHIEKNNGSFIVSMDMQAIRDDGRSFWVTVPIRGTDGDVIADDILTAGEAASHAALSHIMGNAKREQFFESEECEKIRSAPWMASRRHRQQEFSNRIDRKSLHHAP